MPQPVQDPLWASDETNNTEPSLEQKESGWTQHQKGDSAFMNWWMYLVYLWVIYLKNQDFEGDVAVEDDLLVGGDLTVEGNLQVDGNITVTGDIKHGNVTINIPGSAGVTEAESENDLEFFGYSASIDITLLAATVNTTVTWPLTLKVGDRIQSVAFRVLGLVVGVDAVADVAIIKSDGTAQAAGSGSTSVSNVSNAGITTITVTPGTPTAIASSQHPFAALVMSGVSDGQTGIRIYGVDVTYDHP